jgi:hypothetical protein
MQVLSVRQPWAWAIARGHKDVENRTWDTTYRGILAIHGSLRMDHDSLKNPLLRDVGWDPADPMAATGGIVAIVSLDGICTTSKAGHPCDCGPWAEAGACHWQLSNPRPLPEPIMTLGQPGLWLPAPAVMATLAKMMPAEALSASRA